MNTSEKKAISVLLILADKIEAKVDYYDRPDIMQDVRSAKTVLNTLYKDYKQTNLIKQALDWLERDGSDRSHINNAITLLRQAL